MTIYPAAGCFLSVMAVMAPEMSFHPQAAGGETGRARQPKRTRPAWQEAPEWAIGLGWSRCCTPRFEALELLWF